jgi:hypothetical protein
MREFKFRRNVLSNCLWIGAASIGVGTPFNSHAVFQFAVPTILRFIFQGLFRSTASRTVTTTATRTIAAGVTRTTVTSWKTVGSLGITATGIATVSGAVWALADEHKAKSIWVAGSEVTSRFLVTGANEVQAETAVYLGYTLTDVKTGSIEKKLVIPALVVPSKKPFEFPFEVTKLPNPGLKRLDMICSLDSSRLVAHPSFVLPQSQLIVVADPSDVTYG